MDEHDEQFRVDVYSGGLRTNPNVRITHLDSGLVESDASTRSTALNRHAALTRLEERLAQQGTPLGGHRGGDAGVGA